VKLLFMGTPSFAVPSLLELSESFNLVGVVTQPDRPAGRGQRLTPPPVKKTALELGLPVFQPKDKEELYETVKRLSPDAVAVVAYGLILPKRVLELAPKGFLNLHASLLPKYRGAAPIQRALMAGEKKTGNTVILITEKTDAGPILAQEEEEIKEEDHLLSLSERLSKKGARLLSRTLRLWLEGKAEPKPQEEKEATYAPPVKKEELRICWLAPAESVRDRIRGLYPNAYTTFKGKRVKILKAKLFPAEGEPGEVLPFKDKLVVACGEGALEVEELVSPKGKRMKGVDFLRGYSPRSFGGGENL